MLVMLILCFVGKKKDISIGAWRLCTTTNVAKVRGSVQQACRSNVAFRSYSIQESCVYKS
jgi:hypothetical protein